MVVNIPKLARWAVPGLLLFGLLAFLMIRLIDQTGSPLLEDLHTSDGTLYELNPEQWLGQIILLNGPGTAATRLELYPDIKYRFWPGQQMVVHFRAAPDSLEDVAVAVIPITTFLLQEKLRLEIPATLRELGNFYILLETRAVSNSICFWGSQASIESGGLRINGSPAPGALAYTLYRPPAILDYIPVKPVSLRRFGLALLTTLITGTIGLAVLAALRAPASVGLAGLFALALATGIVFCAVLTYLVMLVRVPVTTTILVASFAALGVVAGARGRGWLREPFWKLPLWQGNDLWLDLCLIVLFLLAVLWGLMPFDSLVIPPGSDAWFHNRLLQDIREVGGISDNLSYPAGFHAYANIIRLLLPVTIPELLLIVGKWGSLLIAFSLVLPARWYFKQPAAARLVVFWALFAQSLQGDLFGWGRYSFIFGLVIFPAAHVACLQALTNRRALPLALLLVPGIALIHYGTVVLWGTFLASVLIRRLLLDPQPERWRVILGPLAKILGPVLAMLGFVLLARVTGSFTGSQLLATANQSTAQAAAEQPEHFVRLSLEGAGALGWFGLLALIRVRSVVLRQLLMDLGLWLALLILAYWVQLSFLGAVPANLSNTVIALILFTALLSGALANAPQPWRRVFPILLLPALVYISAGSFNPRAIIFSQADIQALSWASEEIASEDAVLIVIQKQEGRYPHPQPEGWLQEFTQARVYRFEYESVEDLAEAQSLITRKNIPVAFLDCAADPALEKYFRTCCGAEIARKGKFGTILSFNTLASQNTKTRIIENRSNWLTDQ